MKNITINFSFLEIFNKIKILTLSHVKDIENIYAIPLCNLLIVIDHDAIEYYKFLNMTLKIKNITLNVPIIFNE